jgi:hypothetical protein
MFFSLSRSILSWLFFWLRSRPLMEFAVVAGLTCALSMYFYAGLEFSPTEDTSPIALFFEMQVLLRTSVEDFVETVHGYASYV